MPQPAKVTASADELIALIVASQNRLTIEQAKIINEPNRHRRLAKIRGLQTALTAEISRINLGVDDWRNDILPSVYASGGVDTGMIKAWQWNRIHTAALDVIATDTGDSVLAATSFMSRDSKRWIRDTQRALAAQTVLEGQTARQAARQLARAAPRAFRPDGTPLPIRAVQYADGSYRSIDHYAEMLLRTQTAIAYNRGALNTLTAEGVQFVELADGTGCGFTSHDDPDKANESIRTIEQASQYPISHPNCRRAILPRPDLVSLDGAKPLPRAATQTDVPDPPPVPPPSPSPARTPRTPPKARKPPTPPKPPTPRTPPSAAAKTATPGRVKPSERYRFADDSDPVLVDQVNQAMGNLDRYMTLPDSAATVTFDMRPFRQGLNGQYDFSGRRNIISMNQSWAEMLNTMSPNSTAYTKQAAKMRGTIYHEFMHYFDKQQGAHTLLTREVRDVALRSKSAAASDAFAATAADSTIPANQQAIARLFAEMYDESADGQGYIRQLNEITNGVSSSFDYLIDPAEMWARLAAQSVTFDLDPEAYAQIALQVTDKGQPTGQQFAVFKPLWDDVMSSALSDRGRRVVARSRL